MNLETIRKKMNVSLNEWARVVSVSALFFTISTGLELGRIGRDCYFLSIAGADKIPFMYMAVAVIMLILSPVYSRFLGEVNGDGLLRKMASGGALGMASLWFSIRFASGIFPTLPYIVFCAVEAFALFMLMHSWSVIEEVFDAWEGKRFFPIIGAVGLVGKIVGGAITNLIATMFGAAALFPLWCVLLLAVLPLSKIVERTKRQHHLNQTTGSIGTASSSITAAAKGSLPESGDSSLKQVPLIYTLTFMAVPMWIIIYIIEYNYFGVMSDVFPNPDRLAEFFGLFNCVASILGLMLQVFITPRMLQKKGVGNTSIVYPFMLTVASVLLLIFSLFPEADASPRELTFTGIALLVVIARLCDFSFYYSIYDSSSQLLFYSLPDSLRSSGRAFLLGLVLPLCTGAAGGIIILLSTILEQPVYSLGFVAVTLGFLLIALALNITPEYLSSLLRNFQSSSPDRLRDILEEISRMEVSDARYVLMGSVVKQDIKEASFAVEKLFEIRDDELLHDLEEALPEMQPETVKQIVGILEKEGNIHSQSFVRHAAQYYGAPVATG
jgi:ATP:ADP antiporter, AAA family